MIRLQSFFGSTPVNFFPTQSVSIDLTRQTQAAPPRPANSAAIRPDIQGQLFDVRVGDPRTVGYRAPFVPVY